MKKRDEEEEEEEKIALDGHALVDPHGQPFSYCQKLLPVGIIIFTFLLSVHCFQIIFKQKSKFSSRYNVYFNTQLAERIVDDPCLVTLVSSSLMGWVKPRQG